MISKHMACFFNKHIIQWSILLCLLTHTLRATDKRTYFQQRVDYNISVTLNVKLHELAGNVEIKYINHSPDVLHEIYFHLWPNAYKDRTSALCKQLVSQGDMSLYFAPDSLRGFMDNLEFKVNDHLVQMMYDSLNSDICRLILNTPLHPGDSIEISTPFRVKIPDAKFSRLGHVGDSYMITQWYPKPAVYDKDGWHPIPYLSQGEFYSEYGSFNVNITLPENYVVAASGYLQTPSEIKFIENKIKESSDNSDFPENNFFPLSSEKQKTIQFTIDSVHDFAWFADKRFHIGHTTVRLPKSGRDVECYAYYTNAQPQWWKNASTVTSDAIAYYSDMVGEYPYGVCTAVDGTIAAGAGMEYPTITVLGLAASEASLIETIVHEVGHNWFYGILGSNERDHAWMDEGINSFYEMMFMTSKYKSRNYLHEFIGLPQWLSKRVGVQNLTPFDMNKLMYDMLARQNNDQFGDINSSCYTQFGYGATVYSRTAINFYALQKYLGDTLFNKCMQQYFNEWKFKHPSPDDVQQSFETASGKSLHWFFKEWIPYNYKADFKISSIRKNESGYSVKLKNSGTLTAPVSIAAYQNQQLLSSIWVEPFKGKKEVLFPASDADYFIVDGPDYAFDINPLNNFYRNSGLMKRINKVEFAFISKYENPLRTQLFYVPAIGYNTYNGVMAGVILHNMSLLKKKFEFSLMPLYGFKSRTPAGIAMFNYSLLLNKTLIDRIDITANPHYFNADSYYLIKRDENFNQNYFSLPVYVKLRLAKAICRPDVEYSIKAGNILNHIRQYEYLSDHLYWQRNVFQQVELTRNNYNHSDPSEIIWLNERGKGYVKSQLTIEKEITLTKRKRDLYLRFFAGTFLYRDSYNHVADFTNSGWRGSDDYLMQELYSGRNEITGFWSHQMLMKDGGLKAYYPVGSDHWLAGLNVSLKTPLPGVKIFADVVSFYKASAVTPGASSIRYDGGVCFSLMKDVIEIYLPLIISKEIKTYYDLNGYKYTDRIRFVFDLHKLNPVRLRDLNSR
ncbi:MAG: M1 family metallopeptidase [Bacteroidetes bacterium]|nr:M1 family metallopeptidase [Bacteroidota bacterium]